MAIFEEGVWQKHVWSVTVGKQEAAVYRKQHPRRAQGRSFPGWVFMRSTSSTPQKAELFKMIITFMERTLERKGGNIIEEMEMDHDTRWKAEVQSLGRTNESNIQWGCEGQWTVEWNKINKGGKCPLDRRRWKVREVHLKAWNWGGGAAGERLWLATKEETRVCAACQYKYEVSQGLPSR